MVFSNKLTYIKNIYNFKIFKKNIKFKKYNKSLSRYIINRKKYFFKKKRTNLLFYYYIVNNWTLYFNNLRRHTRYYQLIHTFNRLYVAPNIDFINKNSLLSIPFNTSRVPLKNLLNKFFIKFFYNQTVGPRAILLLNNLPTTLKKFINSPTQTTTQVEKLFYTSISTSKPTNISLLSLNLQILVSIRKILTLLILLKF